MKDPICGMKGTKPYTFIKTWYFCSDSCITKFKGRLFEYTASTILVTIAIISILLDVMQPFMGISLLILSMLKLIDIKGFAELFKSYDIIAQHVQGYATVYPFIELAIAVSLLTNKFVLVTATILLIIMSVGSIGVYKSIKRKIQCACLGSKIKVPLTRFTLVEDIIMVGMAIMLLRPLLLF